MAIKRRLRILEKTTSTGSRDIVSADSEKELKRKLAEYKRKNPYNPEPYTILAHTTIIKSRDDLKRNSVINNND